MNRKPNSKRSSIGWIILGVFVISGLLYVGLIAGIASLHADVPDAYSFSTAEITMIPAPTLTPVVAMPTSALPSPTSTQQAPIQVGGISVGAYVKITGTNGDGLNLRSSPGTDSTIRFLGMDSEVFLVKDGPEQVDNIIWWYLQAPYDTTRNGWAAANYLTVIEKP